jgi:hypothetical protein
MRAAEPAYADIAARATSPSEVSVDTSPVQPRTERDLDALDAADRAAAAAAGPARVSSSLADARVGASLALAPPFPLVVPLEAQHLVVAASPNLLAVPVSLGAYAAAGAHLRAIAALCLCCSAAQEAARALLSADALAALAAFELRDAASGERVSDSLRSAAMMALVYVFGDAAAQMDLQPSSLAGLLAVGARRTSRTHSVSSAPGSESATAAVAAAMAVHGSQDALAPSRAFVGTPLALDRVSMSTPRAPMHAVASPPNGPSTSDRMDANATVYLSVADSLRREAHRTATAAPMDAVVHGRASGETTPRHSIALAPRRSVASAGSSAAAAATAAAVAAAVAGAARPRDDASYGKTSTAGAGAWATPSVANGVGLTGGLPDDVALLVDLVLEQAPSAAAPHVSPARMAGVRVRGRRRCAAAHMHALTCARVQSCCTSSTT